MNSKLLAVTLSALVMAACQSAPSDQTTNASALGVKAAGTVVGQGTGGGSGATLACPAPVACFQVSTNGANITHIFIDVDACCAPDPGDYDVTVDGQPVTQLHDGGGGPCKELEREVWFPLQGNQASAEVCLQFHGFVPSHVSVGAKAKNECVATAVDATCTVCGGGGTGSCGGGTGGSGGAMGTGGGGTTGTGAGGGATGAGGGGTTSGGGGAGGGGTGGGPARGEGGASTLPIPK
ncbi:MAG: hypothetical protein QM820_13060 [Minicystis sp.]